MSISGRLAKWQAKIVAIKQRSGDDNNKKQPTTQIFEWWASLDPRLWKTRTYKIFIIIISSLWIPNKFFFFVFFLSNRSTSTMKGTKKIISDSLIDTERSEKTTNICYIEIEQWIAQRNKMKKSQQLWRHRKKLSWYITPRDIFVGLACERARALAI